MPIQPSNNEKLEKVIHKRTEEELLEEEIKNQQTIDIYFDTEKNWC